MPPRLLHRLALLLLLVVVSSCEMPSNTADAPTTVTALSVTNSGTISPMALSPTHTPTRKAEPTGTATRTPRPTRKATPIRPTNTPRPTWTPRIPTPTTVLPPILAGTLLGTIWFLRLADPNGEKYDLFRLKDGIVEQYPLPANTWVNMVATDGSFIVLSSTDDKVFDTTFTLLDTQTHEQAPLPLVCRNPGCGLLVSPDRKYAAINYRCELESVNVAIAPIDDLQSAYEAAMAAQCDGIIEEAFAWVAPSQSVLVGRGSGLVERDVHGNDKRISSDWWVELTLAADNETIYGRQIYRGDQPDTYKVLNRISGQEQLIEVPSHRTDDPRIISQDGRYLVMGPYDYFSPQACLRIYDLHEPTREPECLVYGQEVLVWQPDE